MGYFGYFGQDPTTDPSSGGAPLPPSGAPGTDPSMPSGIPSGMPSGMPSYPSVPSSPYGTPGGAPPGTLPGGTPGTLPSGAPYPGPTTQPFPGSTGGGLQPYPGPGTGGGLQPYPGGSSTNLPGTPVVPGGGALIPLPAGQAWASAPLVRALAGSTTNGALFTNPQNQRAAWIQLVLRQMISSGYFEPGNTAAATGAIAAAAQAYGYFMQYAVNPTDAAAQMGLPGALAAVMTANMINALSDAYAAVEYWQSTPDYQKALNVTAGWIKPGGLTAQDIYRAAAAAQAAATAQAAPPATGSKTLLYVGLAGAAGLAAYLALA